MSPLAWRHMFTRSLKPWAVLHAGGLCCVAALWMVFGGGERGLGPYFEAVGQAALSLERLAWYVCIVSLYSAVLELVLRLVQERLLRHDWPNHVVARCVCLGIPALLYGLTHSIYHVPGVLYALVLGVLTASVYARWRSIGVMAAWHVQWNLLAVGGSMMLALMGPGAPRDHMIATYKATQIARGTVVWHPELGWIDRHHYDIKTYAQALELVSLPAHSGDKTRYTLTVHAHLNTQWGTRHPIARRYAITPHADAEVRRAVACGVTLDFQDFHERRQAELGWWSGLALSAYQRDDLAATWALCMDRETGKTRRFGEPAEPPEASSLLEHVAHTLTLAELRALAMETHAELWARISMARALWRVSQS